MTRAWKLVLGVLVAAGVVAAMRVGWVDDYREVTILLAGLAAVGAVAGALISWVGNRATAQYLKELAVQQEQAAADIRRLAELTESSLEEARAQRPEPVVQWVVGEERTSVSEAVVERKLLCRSIDVEQIAAAERRRLVAAIPRELSADEKSDSPTERHTLAALAGLRALATRFAPDLPPRTRPSSSERSTPT